MSPSAQQMTFTADGGQELLRISASGSWEATSSHDWCTLSAHDGSGDASIRVTVDANLNLEAREAVIELRAGSERSRVVVSQDGLEYITLSTERAMVVNTASSITVAIDASAAWEATKNVEWITAITPTTSASGTNVKVDFAANSGDNNRIGEVTFRIKGSSVTRTLIIEQLSIHGSARQRDSIALEAIAASCLDIDREKYWKRSEPINRWSGITTRPVAGQLRVSELNLNNLIYSHDGAVPGKFGAHLPTEIQFLSELTSLIISNYNLGGEIPAVIGELTNLTTLNLSTNLFVGTLPIEMVKLTKLRVLNLSHNYFTGNLPTMVGDMTSLTDLNLGSNNFDLIPDNFAKLLNLTKLDLSAIGTAIWGGYLPEEQRSQLSKLKLSRATPKYVNVDRVFPVSITYLSKLESLKMHSSNFTGTIPVTISNMQSLSELMAYGNKLSGSIPSSIRYASKLQVLNLANNQLTGSIPEGMANMSQYLLTLILRGNKLTGTLPADFADLYCTYWDLSDNQLTGTIDVLFERGWAREIYVTNNKFSGAISSKIENVKSLERMELSNNSFNSIPDEVFNLTSLTDMRLDNNAFTAINSNLQYLSRLMILHLHNNEITGEVPAFLGNINRLSDLTLSGNRLVGQVPQSLIDLSQKNSVPPASDPTGGAWAESPFSWDKICPQQSGFGVAYPAGHIPDNGAITGGDEGFLPGMGL